MHKVQFYLGEQRHIRLQVHSKENLPFTIRNATWELQYLGKVEASGDCSVQDHILDVKLHHCKRPYIDCLLRMKWQMKG